MPKPTEEQMARTLDELETKLQILVHTNHLRKDWSRYSEFSIDCAICLRKKVHTLEEKLIEVGYL